MLAVFQWVKDAVNSVYQSARSALSTASMVISVANSVLSSKSFRNGLSDWLTQSMEGFWRALSPSNLTTMIKTEKTSSLWGNMLASTLLRFAPVMLYRTIARPFAVAMVRNTISTNPIVETVAVSALDVAATLCVIHSTTRGFANTALNNLSMAKASANETKPVEQSDNPLTKACEHGKKANLSAAVTATLHYYGTLFALRGFANSIPFGDVVTLPLEMLLIGRTCLEYPLRAANNCDEHSLEVLNKNNPYAFGIGASYKASEWVLKRYVLGFAESVIEYYTGLKTAGASNFFVEEILSSMLYLHFIMTANLQRNAKLPGTKPGADIFEPCRLATDAFATSAAAKIAKYFEGPVVGDWYQDGKKNYQSFISKPVIVWLCKFLLDDDLQDWEKFKKRPESKLFFELYGNLLLNGIRYIQRERARKLYKRLDKANKWATNNHPDESFLKIKSLSKYIVKMGIDALASDDDQKMLAFLMQPELEAPLKDWYEYILSAIPDQSIVKSDTVEFVDDYLESDAAALLDQTETMLEAVPDGVAKPVVATTPVNVAALYRLFPANAAVKPAVSMKTETDETLDTLARIISAGK